MTGSSKRHGEVEGHQQWLLKGDINKLNDGLYHSKVRATHWADTTMLYLASKQTVWAQPRVGQWMEGEFSKVRASTTPGQPPWKRMSSVEKKKFHFHPVHRLKKSAFSPVERQTQSSCFLKKLKSKTPHSDMSVFPLRNVGYLYWDSSFLKFKIHSPPLQ